MKPGAHKIGLLAITLASALLCPAEAAAAEASPSPDLIGRALEKRIRGQASLDDVRIDVGWARRGRYSTARIYGNGIVICDGKLQFSVKKTEVTAILKILQQARFGLMPSHFGEAEGEEEEEHEGPRLKGHLALRAGAISKAVQQLAEGEQSQPFEALAVKILAVCQGAEQKGTGAESLADGLQKLASRALAPEVLEITVQRRDDGPNKDGDRTGWILQLEGRRVTDQSMPAGKMPPPPRLLILSDTDFLALTTLLVDARPAEIPLNVYSPEYTDLRLTLLNRSRVVSARRFQSMTSETHGEKQKAFDRIYDAFRALHERVQKDGKTVRVPTSRDTIKETQEREREKEKEKEKKD